MTTGGSGFYTLLWKDGDEWKRLAYIQKLDNEGRAKFYELWNEEAWGKMLGDSIEPLEVLRRSLADETLELRHLIKTPMGVVRQRTYDLWDAKIEPVDCGGEVQVCGFPMAATIRFDSPRNNEYPKVGLPVKEES